MTTPYVVPESVRRLWGVPTTNDLPPKWDGVPVTWGEWIDTRSSLDWHLPVTELACGQCGGLSGRMVCLGIRPPAEGATMTAEREKRTKSGYIYTATVEVPAWPIIDLHAFRCRDCGHDTVHDERTDEHWDLDPDDYGDEGSTENKETLF